MGTRTGGAACTACTAVGPDQEGSDRRLPAGRIMEPMRMVLNGTARPLCQAISRQYSSCSITVRKMTATRSFIHGHHPPHCHHHQDRHHFHHHHLGHPTSSASSSCPATTSCTLAHVHTVTGRRA